MGHGLNDIMDNAAANCKRTALFWALRKGPLGVAMYSQT